MTEMTTKRPITAEDLFQIKPVSDPQASPDGKQIVWVVTELQLEDDTYTSALWIASADGSNARKLTSGAHRDTGPRWSPDGSRVAFISNRSPMLQLPKSDEEKDEKSEKEKQSDGKGAKSPNQIWLIDVTGGEALQVTNHPNGASDHRWSPDGTKLAFVASDDVSEEDPFEAPTSTGPINDERIVRDIRHKFDGRGYIEKYTHIWTIDVNTREAAQVTTGDVFDSSPMWSPDASKIVFVGNRREDRASYFVRNLYEVTLANGTVAVLGPDDVSFGDPVWSPSGQSIAFSGNTEPETGGAKNNRIWTISPDGTNLTNHTASWDVSVGDSGMSDVHMASAGDLIWLDEDRVMFLAAYRGATHLWVLTVSKNEVVQFSEGAQRISGFTVAGDHVVYVSGRPDLPFELYRAPLSGSGKPTQITNFNEALVNEVHLSSAEELAVTAPDGQAVQAWILKPYGFEEGSAVRHPLILQIHGGPHGMYGYGMFHEMQLMAAKGYAVLFSNPRGSSGYGEDFTTTTRGRWGESDAPDVLAAVDAAVDLGWVDKDRLGITGGSYGGYLTNWIIGHDTRFKAAVTQRCVSNFHSFFGTSDIGFTFGVYEFGGTPWADSELLLRHSPISYVDKIETPLLILHSEQDLRCPMEQSEQMFTALKYLGKTVEFVRFPNENHNLSRTGTPSRRLARLHHLTSWFDAHI